MIACEDTRQTLKLLSHFDIQKRLVSYHEHNEITRAAEIVIELEQGAQIALVTDAGTPAISDPGDRLVSLCLRHGIQVVPLPGASRVCGGAGGLGNAHRGIYVRGIFAVAAHRAAQDACARWPPSRARSCSTKRRTACSIRSKTRWKFWATARR